MDAQRVYKNNSMLQVTLARGSTLADVCGIFAEKRKTISLLQATLPSQTVVRRPIAGYNTQGPIKMISNQVLEWSSWLVQWRKASLKAKFIMNHGQVKKLGQRVTQEVLSTDS